MAKITEREAEILKILHNDPMISQEDLAAMVGITRSAIAVHISNLIKKGYILGRGYVFNDKTGVLVLGPVYIEVKAVTVPGDDAAGIVDITPGGPAYFLARHLAGQNIPTSLMSIIGRDEWGELIAEKLKKNHVDTRYLLIQKEYPTPRRVTMVDNRGESTRIMSDRRALQHMSGNNLQSTGLAIGNCRMLVVDTGIPTESMSYVLGLAQEAEVPVCVEISVEDISRFRYEYFKGLFLAVVTGDAAGKLAGMRVKDVEDSVTAGKVLNGYGAEIVVVVLPDQGVVLTGPKESITVPIVPGQGTRGLEETGQFSVDILTAGLVSGILHGYDYRQAIRQGVGIASHLGGKSRNLSGWKEK